MVGGTADVPSDTDLGAARRRRSDGEERKPWVESTQIVRVARDDGLMVRACRDDDRSVDDIGGPGSAAEYAGRLGVGFLERCDVDVVQTEEAGETCLAGTAPPALRQDAGRDGELGPGEVGLMEERLHAAVGTFDGDERSGVEHSAGHQSRPRADRAHRRSSSSGTPVSAAMSARSSVRTSCRMRSARASAMYAETELALPSVTARRAAATSS